MKSNIVVETKNLLLRFFTMDDVKKVFQMSQEEGMRLWIPDQVYEDEARAENVIKFLIAQYSDKPRPLEKPYVLGIELKNTHELIGHVGLSRIEDGVEVGYAIEDRYQGRGYATEAVSAISDWALANLVLPVIWGIVASENKGSLRVLEKANYKLVEEKEKKYLGELRLCGIYKKTQ